MIDYDLDVEWDFSITEKTPKQYTITTSISNWLKQNIEELTDDNDNIIFNKVNYGFNEDTLKSFTGKPVASIYVDNIEYNNTFSENQPDKVNSFIIFTLKGANDNTYLKACELLDYLVYKFVTDESFTVLDGYVSESFITDTSLRVQPIRKAWGLLATISLSHTIVQGGYYEY